MENKIKENFWIQVDSRAVEPHAAKDQKPETIQLTTKGSLVFRGGCWFISYQETEATGFEGCTTTVKVAQDGSRVSMNRYGRAGAHLLIEKGIHHQCHYDTGFGAMTLGVEADEIQCCLGPDGGQASFSYILDMEPLGSMSHNYVTLRVSPVQPAAPSHHKK